MTKLIAKLRSTVVSLALLAILASCTPSLNNSTAVLLVPSDETYASQFQFELIDGDNNYQFFVHWSPEFDPDVDPSLTLVGYQISDLDSWTGEADAEDELTASALVTHAQRALGDSNDIGPDCSSLSSLQGALVCLYEVGQPERLTVMSRTFATSTGPAALIVPGPVDPNRDYLAGDFDEVLPAEVPQLVR